MAETPAISVVICHHTGRDLLNRCLDSVSASVGVTTETVVLTSDPTYTTSRAGVTVYQVEGGPAHKRNVGVARTRAPTVVFLDDDVEVSPYCLYELWRGLDTRPTAGMVFARIYNMERRHELDDCGSWVTGTGFLYARAGDSTAADRALDPIRCLASKSATCAIRRTTFTAVGGFDATYEILGEETDLAWRVWLSGQEVWYEPSAVSWHAFGTSLKPPAAYYTLRRIHYLGARNYVNLLLTNLGGGKLCTILPTHLCVWCVSAAGFLLSGQWRRGWLILSGICSNVRTLQRTRWKRRQVQRTRVVPDRALWPLIASQPPWAYYWRRLTSYWVRGLHG